MKDTVHEAIGIKGYIRYIKQTVYLLRADVLRCSDNQCKYFIEIGNSIAEYEKTHKLYIKYILSRITFADLCALLGVEERQVYRWAEKQRKLLIDFIYERESKFFAKYPFDDELKLGE